MARSAKNLILLVVISGIMDAYCTRVVAAEWVSALLYDGRVISGDLDAATNEADLWLRSSAPAILLRSAFPWNSIQVVWRGDTQLTPEQTRQLAASLTAETSIQVGAEGMPESELTAPPPLLPPEPNNVIPEMPHRVGSIQIEAILENWDHDPEDDGLLIHVIALTPDGIRIPVRGRLNVVLYGLARQGANWKKAFPELGRWSFSTERDDFGAEGAVYQLPFRNFRPEKDLNVASFGLLKARLDVAGQGTFDATFDDVRLRRFSMYRDQLQFQFGERELPNGISVERTPYINESLSRKP